MIQNFNYRVYKFDKNLLLSFQRHHLTLLNLNNKEEIHFGQISDDGTNQKILLQTRVDHAK